MLQAPTSSTQSSPQKKQHTYTTSFLPIVWKCLGAARRELLPERRRHSLQREAFKWFILDSSESGWMISGCGKIVSKLSALFHEKAFIGACSRKFNKQGQLLLIIIMFQICVSSSRARLCSCDFVCVTVLVKRFVWDPSFRCGCLQWFWHQRATGKTYHVEIREAASNRPENWASLHWFHLHRTTKAKFLPRFSIRQRYT